MSQMYAACDTENHKAKVHFYYDNSLNCGKNSEALIPSYFANASCHYMCNKDGYFTAIDFDIMKQTCQKCRGNSISIDGGFIVDGAMGDRFRDEFEVACLIVKLPSFGNDKNLRVGDIE